MTVWKVCAPPEENATAALLKPETQPQMRNNSAALHRQR